MAPLKISLFSLALIVSMGASPVRAAEPTLGAAITAAVAAIPGWVVAVEQITLDGRSAVRVMVVTEEDQVHAVLVEAGVVTRHIPLEETRGRALAADLRAGCGDARPDLAQLAQRVEGMAAGCKVAEVELERHGDDVVAEVECVRGTLEIELVFDPRDGRLVALEVEDDHEDEGDHEDEDDQEDD